MDLTRGRPAPGLVCWQPRKGYRYGVEAYLLADFALDAQPRRVAELGAGSGIVSLLLASAGVEVLAVERHPDWWPILARNVAESGLDGLVRVVHADARTFTAEVDLVVTNPPWFDPAAGPPSPDPWKAAARTASHGTPEELVAAGLRYAPVAVVGPRVPAVGHPRRLAHHGRLAFAELTAAPGPVPRPAPVDVAAAYARFGVPAPGPRVE